MKVGIVGAGAVGTSCMMAMALRGSAHDIILVNRNQARNPADEEFGLERLIDLCATRYGSTEGLLTAVMDAIVAWSGDSEQGDDITLLTLAVGDA